MRSVRRLCSSSSASPRDVCIVAAARTPIGGFNGSLASVPAAKLGATAIILVHNHPSGDPTPSKADIRMTKEITDAAERLGIIIHDHLVIGRSGHASFKSLGLL